VITSTTSLKYAKMAGYSNCHTVTMVHCHINITALQYKAHDVVSIPIPARIILS